MTSTLLIALALALAEPATLREDARLQPLSASIAAAAERHSLLLSVRHTAAQPSAPRTRSPAKVVLGAVVGAVGGFFAGGYLGAKIEGNDCHCDDPGLKGFLIGAPVGAVAGGILGGFYLF